MPVEHCVAKIKRNFGAGHAGAQGTLGGSGVPTMPGEKENVEQTSLKVCTYTRFCKTLKDYINHS